MAVVRATTSLKHDFDSCADYLTTFVVQNKSNQRNVSKIDIKGGDKDSGGGRGGRENRNGGGRYRGRGCGRSNCDRYGAGHGDHKKRKLEGKYYPFKEYSKLTKEEKKKVHELHTSEDDRFSKVTEQVQNISSLVQNMSNQIPNVPTLPTPALANDRVSSVRFARK